jgi:hypothetical protein
MTVPDVCERFDPGFDDVDRRAPFTINAACRTLDDPNGSARGARSHRNDSDLHTRMENSCSGRESIRFDAVKIKLLTDAHPSFSYLQQIRDASPFWSRHFQQRPSETGAVSRFRAE